MSARRLLSHSSGLPDVADYGWHDLQLHDDALSEFARSLSGWRLRVEPGSAFGYSNAGFELLGLLLSHDVRRRRQASSPGPTRDAEQHLRAFEGADGFLAGGTGFLPVVEVVAGVGVVPLCRAKA